MMRADNDKSDNNDYHYRMNAIKNIREFNANSKQKRKCCVKQTERDKISATKNYLNPTTDLYLINSSICIQTVISFTFIIILASINKSAEASLSACDYERYPDSGCYSGSNLVCDSETLKCKCQSETPVLIDGRFCVARRKANEICQYNQECDNQNGYYCSFLETNEHNNNQNEKRPQPLPCPHDPAFRNYFKDHEQTHTKCRCHKASQWFAGEPPLLVGPEAKPGGGSSSGSGGRWFWPLHSHGSPWHSANAPSDNANINNNDNSISYKPNIDNHPTNTPNHSHYHHTTSSILPRLVWIFLIIVLLALFALLFLIKFQSYRTDRPFHQAEDRRSINSEPDLPPPYEVAIRMKL